MFTVKVLELTDWNTPASIYEPRDLGNYRIARHTFIPGYYNYNGIEGYTFYYVRKPLIGTKLMELTPSLLGGASKYKDWMVDSPTDYRAMQIYAKRAYGKVLTTGLGLGLVTHELCKNDKVESITVVEISPTVIELIGGYLPKDNRIKIINDDFWKFIEQDNTEWDTIIVDLWVFWGPFQQFKEYKEEVYPASGMLRLKYPQAQIVFHGFAGLPKMDAVVKAFDNGDDTTQLIFGLQEENIINA